tara:strand:+ start:282 stop:503 length:222 start_codon:yes stop_codon:yes gene_type:complete
MIFTLAFYVLEGTVSTTVWTTKKVYNWWYQVPPEPTLHEIKEELDTVMKELRELKKLKNDSEIKLLEDKNYFK